MLKNLSDYISLFTMIFMCFYAIDVFILSFVNKDKDDNTTSRWELLKDYLDNEEE